MRWLPQGLRPGSPAVLLLRLTGLLALLFASPPLPAQNVTAAALVRFPGSIREIPANTPAALLTRSHPAITRDTLTAAELSAPLQIEVAFAMRDFSGLQQHLARGERLSPQTLATRYLPLAADYNKTADWLAQRGLKITHRDPNHLALFVEGTVRQIQSIFNTSFARVSLDGREYSSAITAPSLPTELASPILGINGLQPHLRLQPYVVQFHPSPNSTTANSPPYTPAQIAQVYNASGLSQTGANQTIAIVIDTFPNTSDLTAFWSDCNIPQSIGNIDFIQVVTGTLPAADLETSLDVEWTSSLAPAAKIRVYATLDLALTDLDLAYDQIIADLPTQPTLHQVSMSFGGPESTDFPNTELATDAQLFATMAASGVTVCVSSGDGGSRPNDTTGQYDSSAALTPEYPASDPGVTSVGGTSIAVNSTTGSVTAETAWTGSGGGISSYFPRPAWQTGPGVPTGAKRLVPDVSADADPNSGGMVILDGSTIQVGGTSLAAPTWASFCTLINQARADASLPSLGYLNPLLYPLNGSAYFRDITSGSNGDYSAGPGYDLVTGLGVPAVSSLITLFLDEPSIITPPNGQEVLLNTSANFSLVAAGPGPLSYQWQRLPIGASIWANLTDNATYSGSTTSNLTVANTTASMSGDQFQCVVSNAFGNVTSFPFAPLVINIPFVVTTFAGQNGIQGANNGVGANAQFNLPIGLATDSGGNLFIADTYNQLIRKITANGTVTTIAGTANVTGATNGTHARFNYPTGIAVDSSGNLYVTDNNNDSIRKITPNGTVSTFAGSSSRSGSTNGLAASARFLNPNGVAVDSSGNVYVADTGNSLIRKISGGLVSTFAGVAGNVSALDGVGAAATFADPWGIAVDANKNIYVADTYNQTIRKITPNGTVTTIAGQPGVSGFNDGLAANALFSYPTSLAVDSSGDIFVCENNNSDIREISPAGVVSTPAGDPEIAGNIDGTGTSAQFNFPFGVALAASGNLDVADTNNNIIRQGVLVTAAQIQTPPQNLAVVAGQNAAFTLAATCNPAPAFQWQFSPDSGATWSNLADNATIAGSATNSLTINSTTLAMSGEQFRCLISNAYGSATSAAVTLTVNTPPAITLQPLSATVTQNITATFTTAATGAPNPAYSWQSSTNGSTWTTLADNATISGSATTSLSILNPAVALSGEQFRCLVTNGITPNATTNPATLTVTALSFAQTMARLGLTGASALPTARPFPDGLTNLARYAMNLGANPSPSQLPQTNSLTTNGTAYITFQYRVLKNLVGVTVTPQSSTDLLNWTNVPPINLTQLADPDPQTSLYLVTLPIPNNPIFLRLQFTQSP